MAGESNTNELMDNLSAEVRGGIWEPAAGRGDVTSVLQNWGIDVFSSDIDMSQFDYNISPAFNCDFVTSDGAPIHEDFGPTKGIITNPPYNVPRGIAEKFVRHSIELMVNPTVGSDEIEFIAMLLRSEFNAAKTRRDIFGDCEHYFGEVVLTKRPRWDWWFREKPIAGPRHNFSWFVWAKRKVGEPASQFFHYI